MKILDKLVQLLSILYYLVMFLIPIVLYYYSLRLIAYAFFIVIVNNIVLQFKLAKLATSNKNIVGNQVSLTQAVNAVTHGRRTRRNIKKQKPNGKKE